MAVERLKEFTLELGELIKVRIESFSNIRRRILAKREAEFQRRISEEGVSYQSQLDYRNQQVIEEKKKKYPDGAFLEELKSDTAYLKKMVRYEKVRNKYLESYTSYKEGKLAIESVVTILNNQLSLENDPKLRSEILTNLSNIKIEKAKADLNILNDRVLLAQKDKSIALTDKVIEEVNQARSRAVVSGDKEAVASFDVKLSVLNNQKQELIATDDVRSTELKAIREGLTASQKLTLLDGVISGADRNSPVTIDGARWDSAFEYWAAQKDAYISGSGKGEFQDFFSEFSTEITNRINRLSALNQFGAIPTSTIDSINQDYNTLSTRTDFAPYLNKLENYKVSSLSLAIGKTAEAIIGEASLFGEWTAGVQSLKALGSKFGIDTEVYVADLWLKQLTFEPATAEAAMKLAEFRADQKGTTPQEELEKITEVPIEPTIIKKPEEEKPTPTEGIVIPTGEAAVGKQVRIGGELYPSQEWYDVNI